MMGKSVKICNDLYASAKAVAKAERRTTGEQIEFWANIGRILIQNPDIPTAYVVRIIAFQIQSPLNDMPKYKLEELLDQYDPGCDYSQESAEWLDMPPAGREIW